MKGVIRGRVFTLGLVIFCSLASDLAIGIVSVEKGRGKIAMYPCSVGSDLSAQTSSAVEKCVEGLNGLSSLSTTREEKGGRKRGKTLMVPERCSAEQKRPSVSTPPPASQFGLAVEFPYAGGCAFYKKNGELFLVRADGDIKFVPNKEAKSGEKEFAQKVLSIKTEDQKIILFEPKECPATALATSNDFSVSEVIHVSFGGRLVFPHVDSCFAIIFQLDDCSLVGGHVTMGAPFTGGLDNLGCLKNNIIFVLNRMLEKITAQRKIKKIFLRGNRWSEENSGQPINPTDLIQLIPRGYFSSTYYPQKIIEIDDKTNGSRSAEDIVVGDGVVKDKAKTGAATSTSIHCKE